MAFRPDLVDVWVFRVVASDAQVLLMRRSAGRVLAGLWQGASGRLEAGERVAEGALRELREETGFERPVVEAFFDLDFVNQFHYAPADAILTAAVFAVRVGPNAEPRLSHEHDTAEWLPLESAFARVVWPGYRDAIRRVADNLLDADRAAWFELGPDGHAIAG